VDGIFAVPKPLFELNSNSYYFNWNLPVNSTNIPKLGLQKESRKQACEPSDKILERQKKTQMPTFSACLWPNYYFGAGMASDSDIKCDSNLITLQLSS